MRPDQTIVGPNQFVHRELHLAPGGGGAVRTGSRFRQLGHPTLLETSYEATPKAPRIYIGVNTTTACADCASAVRRRPINGSPDCHIHARHPRGSRDK
jgi:hypothetical protein